MKYGSVIERIEPFHIESIPVYEPSSDLSNSVTQLIVEYMDCLYNAFSLEEKALQCIEREIEQSDNPNC